MLTVFSKVLVIFLMIAAGYALCKMKILPQESEKYLVDSLLLVFSPCLIIYSLSTKELGGETFTEALQVMGSSLAYFIIMPFICLLFIKFMKNTPKEDLGVLMVTMTGMNTGFMGFPVTKAIFGDEMFFLMVCENITLNIYLYCISLFQVNYGHKSSGGMANIKKMFTSPALIASIVGLLFLFTPLNLPGFAADFFDLMGQGTIPVSMLVVGIRLANSDFKRMFANKDLIFTSAISLLLVPFLTYLAMIPLPFSNTVKAVMVFAAAFPAAALQVSIAAKEGRNPQLSAEGVALTTGLSMITLPIIATLISHIYGV